MLEIKNGAFFINGKKENIYSGAMHYFRIMPQYWRDRLEKLRAAGLNTVETYVAWNIHEPRPGEYYFSGMADIEQYIRIAQELGLNVIVRPGPYICAEWDFGGFPAWLLKDENIRLRCYEKRYITAVERYFRALMPRLVPLLSTNGGPIIAMQVENEYGSFGSDKKYLHWLRELMIELGVDVQLFTSDGESRFHLSGGGLREDLMVVNFGGYNERRFDDLKLLQPDKPLMCGEHWCGWFDQWGVNHHTDSPDTLGRSLDGFFAENASFNLYMFHGGTNFGFSSGANYYERYQPTVTSYDYGAPLSECGGYTEKYHILRDKMAKHLGRELPELPADTATQSLGRVKLTERAPLMANVKKLGRHIKSHLPYYMEHYGQQSGLILYRTVIKGNYPDTSINATGVHDIAYVYVNGEYKGSYDRTCLKGKALADESFSFPIEAFDGEITVDILVQALGRVNFDKRIYDRKGVKGIFIGGQLLTNFDVYCMELDTPPSGLSYFDAPCECPAFMRGEFEARENADCFIDMKGFKNCAVYVNGFNLGRILSKGPQRTLYLPGVLLSKRNEIVVLELEGAKKPEIVIVDKPIYTK